MASLLALSRAASEEAKRFAVRALWLHVVALAFAIVGLELASPWGHSCGVLALIAELIAWVLRFLSSRRHTAAETARRAALLMNGYGTAKEPADAADIRAGLGTRIEVRAASMEDPDYFSSTEPPGRSRFLDLFAESAFWSKHLYRLAGHVALGSFVAVLTATVVLFVLLTPTGVSPALVVFARVLVPTISFFISVDLLGLSLGWYDAAGTADSVDRTLRAEAIADEADVIRLFAEYGAATATSVPIPTWLYDRQHDRLNREWNRRKGRA